MNLRQLHYLCEIVDQNLNVSLAAKALHTSQPGVSKQIRLLEESLGIEILVRRSNRIIAITEQGEKVVEIARRMLQDAVNIKRVGKEYAQGGAGSLQIATTHAHGRYLLLPIVQCFRERYPSINIRISQADPAGIAQLVAGGTVDLGVGTSLTEPPEDIVALPFYRMTRGVITPPKHPLLRKKEITFEDLARYPMVTLDSAFAGGRTVLEAFRRKGLEPNIVLSATDADVIKAYVEAGLGIATLPTMAFNAAKDRGIRLIEADHLFEPLISCVWIHRYSYLRSVVSEFIYMLSNVWTREAIQQTLEMPTSVDKIMAQSSLFRANNA